MFYKQVEVMLMSLKAGNLGLNMVAASHVILLDLWWNPSAEDQAIDRAHRIGQTRPVSVTRVTIKDTVEDRMLFLQVCSCFVFDVPFSFCIFLNYLFRRRKGGWLHLLMVKIMVEALRLD